MHKILIVFLLAIAIAACQKKEQVLPEINGTKTDKLVISSDSVSTISSNQIQLLSSAFLSLEIRNKFKHNVAVYKINYATTYKGNKITASGLMYLPEGITASSPLLSVQHGTTFVKNDAPSVALGFTGVEFFASAGYITLMPDYIGYGASVNIAHPYYDATHSALSVVDMIKAVKEFLHDKKNLVLNSKLFLTGYSEGGYVTLATQRYLETSPSGFNITAVSAGAGGYDMVEMLNSIGTNNYYSYPAYLAFIIHSYNSVYDWGKPNNYFYTAKYALRLDTLLNGNTDGNFINTQLTTNMDSLLNSSFYNGLKGSGESQFKNALVQNSVTDWQAKAPIKLYHGTKDADIPFENSVSTYEKLKSKGAAIELIQIPEGTHGSSLSPTIVATFNWFETLR